MRILFLMDSPEYLRFYDSAVEELARRGHSVAIAVNHQREKKPVGLGGLRAYADRVSVLGVVPEPQGLWSAVARDVRATMDFLRFLHPDFAAAPALRARMKRKALPRVYHWLDAIPCLSARTTRVLVRMLTVAERAIPTCESIAAFLRTHRPDVLLVSPLVTAASVQVDWIKAARACGIRTAVCIASWDNLTNKGLLRIEPDLVIVWNEAQKREAVDYHYVPAEKVAVTGAQLFDRWFEKTATRGRDAFCRRVGLPDSAPFVLFTGSSSFISESSAEVAFVRRWVEALRQSADPVVRAVNVLVRPHPYNCHRWAADPLADVPGVTVYPRTGYNPIDVVNRNDFFDSLYHCAAVVGINTSAMIEAAIVGRPVCSLLAPEFAGTQEGTIHFRHLLPQNGGFLRIAATIDEHIAQLGDCLRNPDAVRVETERFVGTFVRPHGIDRPATPIFADAVARLCATPPSPPERAPVWRHAVRPVVLAAYLPALIVEAVSDGALQRIRKRVASGARRGRKRMARVGSRWRRYFKEAW
jgi:predicted small integral membrane protein